MRKIILTVGFLGAVLCTSAQCSTVSQGIRALNENNIDLAIEKFTSAGEEIQAAEKDNKAVDAKCYAEYYFGAGSAQLFKYQNNMDGDLANNLATLNKAESFFKKFFELDYHQASLRAKAVTQLEGVANSQKKIGVELYAQKKYAESLDLFEKCIKNKDLLGVDHLDLHAYKCAAVAAGSLGEFEKGIEYNQKLIDNPSLNIGSSPNAMDANYKRKAEYQAYLGDVDGAILTLDSAAAKMPGNITIQKAQLKIFQEAEMYDRALTVLESLTQKVQDEAYMFVIMGQIYAQKKEDEKAAEAYKKALGIEPKNVNALYGMGVYYVNKSNEYVSSLNTVGNSQSDNKAKEGSVEMQEKNLRYAVNYFEQVLEAAPTDRDAMYALMEVYKKLKDETKVEEYRSKLAGE